MASTYVKLFNKILTSSIWDADDKTRLVWITMLAMTDENGVVLSTVNGIAVQARVDKQAALNAIASFLAPDPESRTKEYGGRRLEVVDGGWRLLNHGKYREMMSVEHRRAYWKEKQAEKRARMKAIRSSKPLPGELTYERILEAEGQAEADAFQAMAENGVRVGESDPETPDLP